MFWYVRKYEVTCLPSDFFCNFRGLLLPFLEFIRSCNLTYKGCLPNTDFFLQNSGLWLNHLDPPASPCNSEMLIWFSPFFLTPLLDMPSEFVKLFSYFHWPPPLPPKFRNFNVIFMIILSNKANWRPYILKKTKFSHI